jgi:carboxypeptidase Taq
MAGIGLTRIRSIQADAINVARGSRRPPILPKLRELKTILAEVSDLNNAAAVLSWDEETFMPESGAKARGQQLATLDRLAHIRFTSDRVGELLADLKQELAGTDPNSDVCRLIEVTAQDYTKAVRVPPDFVGKLANVSTLSHRAWIRAKKMSDFSIFRPHLEKMVEMHRQYATFFPTSDHPYDVLLDDSEPGMKTADLRALFETLRPGLVNLIGAIASRPQVDNSFLHLDYDKMRQRSLAVEVITKFGFDWKHGRLDETTHPFMTSFGVGDVRIATRRVPNPGISSFFDTIHEGGHGLLQLGVNPAFERTPLNESASVAMDESQALLWENLVGRSLPFWEHFYPRCQKSFSSQLGSVPLMNFYRGLNRVEPSLVRTEADEITYNLHVILRAELEIGLLERQISVKDLPELWNAKMKEYLGLTPPDDTRGVLQDGHWSSDQMGYFPSYIKANLIGAQLWEKINHDISDLSDQIRSGRFNALLGWLREKVYVHGRKFEPQELVRMATGSEIAAEPYLRYLRQKFGQIYGL